jgi:uncharacterized protein (TIGR03437 family)
MIGKMQSIALAATVVCGFAAAENLLAASCPSTVIAYQASGTFGTTLISGADKLKLAGEPFSITLYACQSKSPSQTGSDYDVYASIELTGTVKSSLILTPYNIKPTATTLILVQPATGTDTIQVQGALSVFGGSVNIKGTIALPAGTLASRSIAPFSSVSIVTAKSGFTYSQGSLSTTLALIGTASGTVYTSAGTPASSVLHASAATVITEHSDGTQSVRPMQASPVDLGTSSDTVMLRFYASGVREADEVHVQIAGQNVPVRYSGASGQFPGLDEVTVELPRSLAGMGDVDVVLTADGQTASPVLVHIR